MEIWNPIVGYEVSNLGNVRSLPKTILYKNGKKQNLKGKQKSIKLNKYGYLTVYLTKNDVIKTCVVHRLVALAFIPNPNPENNTINHIDGNKTNNRIENLEWLSLSDNVKHQWRTGLGE